MIDSNSAEGKEARKPELLIFLFFRLRSLGRMIRLKKNKSRNIV